VRNQRTLLERKRWKSLFFLLCLFEAMEEALENKNRVFCFKQERIFFSHMICEDLCVILQSVRIVDVGLTLS